MNSEYRMKEAYFGGFGFMEIPFVSTLSICTPLLSNSLHIDLFFLPSSSWKSEKKKNYVYKKKNIIQKKWEVVHMLILIMMVSYLFF